MNKYINKIINFRFHDQNSHRKYTPGEPGIWVMILGDMIIFSIFFVILLAHRGEDINAYRQSQALLNVNLGAINTLLLLTSSGFVVAAMDAVHRNKNQMAVNALGIARLLGSCFVIVKIVEYYEKSNLTYPANNDTFFIFYFVFTGVHLIHLLIGLGALTFMISLLRRDELSSNKLMNLENFAIFWHMVDLLWIILFSLIYLVN